MSQSRHPQSASQTSPSPAHTLTQITAIAYVLAFASPVVRVVDAIALSRSVRKRLRRGVLTRSTARADERVSAQRFIREVRAAARAAARARKKQVGKAKRRRTKVTGLGEWPVGLVKRDTGEAAMGGVVVDRDFLPGPSGAPASASGVGQDTPRWRRRSRRIAATRDDPPPSNMGVFARLPGELRNQIYRFALVEPPGTPHTLTMQPGPGPAGPCSTCDHGPCSHAKLRTGLPGLLNASRQLRTEALPLFLAENDFAFDARTTRARCGHGWLATLGPYARLVRGLELRVGVRTRQPDREFPIGLTRAPGGDGRLLVSIGLTLRERAPKECRRLKAFVAELNRTMAGCEWVERADRVVWSDLLADLVFRAARTARNQLRAG